MRITVDDFREAGICPRARVVFFEPHGLDWRKFVKEGIDVEELRATGQQPKRLERLIAIAEKRLGQSG